MLETHHTLKSKFGSKPSFSGNCLAWIFAGLLAGGVYGVENTEIQNPLAAKRPACALLELELIPDSAHIRLNGEYLDAGVWLLSLPAGNHEIRAGAPGFQGELRRITLGVGEKRKLRIHLSASSVSSTAPSKP